MLFLAAISPALGQAVTLADLEGALVEVRFLRQQTIFREGREISNQFQNDLKIEIGPADTTRGAGGLNCTASQSFAREQGIRGIILDSGIDNVPTVIVSTKPISSRCRVTKQSESGAQ
jgi:hypothetical protein